MWMRAFSRSGKRKNNKWIHCSWIPIIRLDRMHLQPLWHRQELLHLMQYCLSSSPLHWAWYRCLDRYQSLYISIYIHLNQWRNQLLSPNVPFSYSTWQQSPSILPFRNRGWIDIYGTKQTNIVVRFCVLFPLLSLQIVLVVITYRTASFHLWLVV